MAAMTLDEFFELAQLGGQIKACHDIFEILGDKDLGWEEMTDKLEKYQKTVFKEFQRSQLKFKMAGGKVRTDEDSIETL